jgi:hypothetical protein
MNTLPAELLICGYMIPAQKVLDGREGREKREDPVVSGYVT